MAYDQRAKEYDRKARTKRRALISEYKRVPCARCGKRYPSYVMDFHHRDPSSKAFSIGRNFKASLERLLEEIAKCDVLCANCHRIVEYETLEQPIVGL